MKITEYIKKHTVYLDGGTGTLLQAAGLNPGELPERWNLTHPDVVRKIHKDYYDGGSNIVSANTFGANILKFSSDELENIISSAVGHVRYALETSATSQEKWVALDIGPTGRMLKPLGDLDFEDAVEIFAKTVRLGVKYGVDLFFIQTMNDCLETKAALLAVKENSNLPVFVTNAYGEDGKLMTGADPSAMVAMLEAMGADAIGANCSLGPSALRSVAEEYIKYSSIPVIMKPNAGMPRIEGDSTVYDLSADDFASEMAYLCKKGVSILGGCCGTTADYIAKTVSATKNIPFKAVEKKSYTVASSYTHSVVFEDRPVIIGERINPTGKPRFKDALRRSDMQYILNEALSEEQSGAHILDVNIGLPEVCEKELLPRVIHEIQSVTDLPLQIDSSDVSAVEAALRIYNGKAVVNSVNGKAESMSKLFPLIKKYGGLLVALTLDENGIPATAEERLAIAEKILCEAYKWGIDKKDLIFDPLTMAVSADPHAANETLRAVKLINERLGCHTVLGVSNVSFGLPCRDLINAAFFTKALSSGLSAAIMNPHSAEMKKAYYSHLVLSGETDGCSEYISFAEGLSLDSVPNTASNSPSDLRSVIIKGLKEQALELTRRLLGEKSPMDIVNGEIIPALNTVGEGFEAGRVYLPQLLMSAEAAKSAFEVIKSAMPEGVEKNRCRIVIATVKGDVHDIGKNIVKLVLENYGYTVIDLGKSVSPEDIASAAQREGAKIVGLSALMTTTVPYMEETIKLIKMRLPHCRIMVGGAVLTEEYAISIGADAYAKDAIEAVKCAEKLENL